MARSVQQALAMPTADVDRHAGFGRRSGRPPVRGRGGAAGIENGEIPDEMIDEPHLSQHGCVIHEPIYPSAAQPRRALPLSSRVGKR